MRAGELIPRFIWMGCRDDDGHRHLGVHVDVGEFSGDGGILDILHGVYGLVEDL